MLIANKLYTESLSAAPYYWGVLTGETSKTFIPFLHKSIEEGYNTYHLDRIILVGIIFAGDRGKICGYLEY